LSLYFPEKINLSIQVEQKLISFLKLALTSIKRLLPTTLYIGSDTLPQFKKLNQLKPYTSLECNGHLTTGEQIFQSKGEMALLPNRHSKDPA